MRKINKRISKREYEKRICPQSGKAFIPTDARQKYFNEQYRIDFHNDQRKVKQARLIELNIRLLKNEAILLKAYTSLKRLNQTAINLDVLLNDGYDFKTLNRLSINETTGNQIYWSLSCGIEGYDEALNTYIIHKND